MRLIAVMLLSAVCQPTNPTASAPTPPTPSTFNDEPILPGPQPGGGSVVLRGSGCCLLNVACGGADEQGVRWADTERRIPCWSTCGNQVEGYSRTGNWLRDLPGGASGVTLDGVEMQEICLR